LTRKYGLAQLWEICSAPDNVRSWAHPAASLLIILAWKQAHANRRVESSNWKATPRSPKTHHRKTLAVQGGLAKGSSRLAVPAPHRILAAIIVHIHSDGVVDQLNATLEEPANPNLTMNLRRAPWYFLGLQEMLVYFESVMAGRRHAHDIIIGFECDSLRRYESTEAAGIPWKQRKFSIGTFLFGFIILWDRDDINRNIYSRPGWQWFWPGRTWDQTPDYEVNRGFARHFRNHVRT